MIKIALYGKGGIGKSTTASNLSAAFADLGHRVMQIGCDPKADSTQLLLGGKEHPAILDILRNESDSLTLENAVHNGEKGVLCVEAGGPTPGIGCAGRGIITAFEKLDELNAYETLKPEIIIYDVLGDVVCGGFAMPLRKDYADYVYVVTSGEKMALFAARNIVLAIESFRARRYASLGGFILNRRNVKDEYELVKAVADEAETKIVADIPRSPLIQEAEEQQMTVLSYAPESDLAQTYRELAQHILRQAEEK